MTKCEGCEKEKEVTEVEGHLLCKECLEDIVRCEFCDRFLAVNYDELEIDNYGTLSVPELTLPDKQMHLLFCNIDCLEAYLKKYRQELKDRDRGIHGEICTVSMSTTPAFTRGLASAGEWH